ncbi:MAG: M14 family zinc carboxypeptidase [Christensenellales bacterium]
METLYLGSTGPQVEYLQLALQRAGFDAGEIDGIFGMKTQLALQRFQRAKRLAADCVAGPQSWQRLLAYLLGYVVHSVRKGDSAAKIAHSFTTSAQAIETANPRLAQERLQPGQDIIVPLGFDIVPVSVRYSSKLLNIVMDGLKSRYPFITSQVIGHSVMGRQLHALQLGKGKTEVFYHAAHHANEWITVPLLLKFLENYAKAFVQKGKIYGIEATELYDNTTLYMTPLVNPDGVDLVTGALCSSTRYYAQAREYAKDYPDIAFPCGYKANINGVDLNLNYPAGWETAKEIKCAQGYVSPAPRDFVGPGPLSEPEACAVFAFTRSRDFTMTLSYHTQGKEIYWRYGCCKPAHSYELAQIFARASSYAVADPPENSSHAGYKDWFVMHYDRPGFTIEAGEGENPLPLSQFEEIYADNAGIMALGLKMMPLFKIC